MTGEFGTTENEETFERSRYIIDRPLYDQNNFDEMYKEFKSNSNKCNINEFKKRIRGNCTRDNLVSALYGMFPIIDMFKTYKKSYVLWDFIAGITMCVFHIPQGLAYGLLAGLLPINGLYTSVFPVIIYVIFASSRNLSMGTFALMSLLISDTINQVSADFVPSLNFTSVDQSLADNSTLSLINEERLYYRLQIGITTTFMAGIIQLVCGLLRMGFLINYMSDALVSGFTTAAAFHVVTSQLPTIFGIQINRYSGIQKVVMSYYDFFGKLPVANPATIIISAICMLVLAVTKEHINPVLKRKIKFPLPIELLVVITATVISYLTNLGERFNFNVVGEVPRGLPLPLVPDFSLVPKIISGSITLAVVGYAISASLVKTYAAKKKYRVDYNQELCSHGLSNVFGSFFRCHFAAGALGRTTVVFDVGMETQVGSIVSTALMFLVLLFIGPLFEPLPRCVLSSIIVVSLKGVFMQVIDLKSLWKISIFDFLIWIVTFLSTVFLDITLGLIIGFGFTIFSVVFRTQEPKARVLGQIINSDIYKDFKVYPQAKQLPGIVIFRFDGPVYFANVNSFRNSLYLLSKIDPEMAGSKEKMHHGPAKPIRKSTIMVLEDVQLTEEMLRHLQSQDQDLNIESTVPVHHIILDCSMWSYIDSAGVRTLRQILDAYRKLGIRILLANCKSEVRYMFLRLELYSHDDKDYMFLTLHDAVLDAQDWAKHHLEPRTNEDRNGKI